MREELSKCQSVIIDGLPLQRVTTRINTLMALRKIHEAVDRVPNDVQELELWLLFPDLYRV